jgi:hypothetical protein
LQPLGFVNCLLGYDLPVNYLTVNWSYLFCLEASGLGLWNLSVWLISRIVSLDYLSFFPLNNWGFPDGVDFWASWLSFSCVVFLLQLPERNRLVFLPPYYHLPVAYFLCM